MKRRLCAALLAAVLGIAGLGGCWDRRELEDVAFVLALGLDPTPDGREMEVTMMVAVPSKLGGEGGGGGEGGKPVMITRVRTPAMAEANTIANAYINRYVSLQHTKTLVLSEAFVRQGYLPLVLDSLARVPALRRTVSIIVSRGRAGELLEQAKPELERAPNRYLEMLTRANRFTGMSPREARVHELATQMENPGGVPLLYLADVRKDAEQGEGGEMPAGGDAKEAEGNEKQAEGDEKPEAAAPIPPGTRRLLPGEVPRRGGPNIDLVGALAFHKNRIAGELSGREVRVVSMVRGEFQRAAVSFPDPRRPQRRIALDLRRAASPEVRPYWADGRVALDILVPLEAELLGVESRIDYTRADLLPELEAAVARYLEEDARTLLRRTREWGADVFLLGYKAARAFDTYPAWVAYDWEARYPETRVDIRFQVRVRRFGDQLSPLRPREEKQPPAHARARGAPAAAAAEGR